MTSFPFIAPFFIPSQQTGKRHDKEIESHFSGKPKRVEKTNIQEEITDQGVDTYISVWTEKFPQTSAQWLAFEWKQGIFT